MMHQATVNKTVFHTVKARVLAAAAAVVAAVALPQLFHALGAVSGLGTALGETFLPMHLAILAVGLLAGPVAGAAAGALSPMISFALSGMPGAAMLPFMVAELFAYGLAAGLIARVRMNVFFKLLIAQVAGRAVRAAAVLIAFYGFGAGPAAASIWTGLVMGLPGIALQWALIPLLVFWVERKARHE